MRGFQKKINITELSRLTNKTRPSIYKYVDEYITKEYKDIPNSFIVLFDKINRNESKQDIIKYCESNFLKITSNDKLNQIISLLKNNYEKIDLDKLEEQLKEEIK